MAKDKKQWSDMSPQQRAGAVAGALVQIALQAAALLDLRRRPAEAVRGPKWAWVAASFVNTVGPVSYFVFGRRKP